MTEVSPIKCSVTTFEKYPEAPSFCWSKEVFVINMNACVMPNINLLNEERSLLLGSPILEFCVCVSANTITGQRMVECRPNLAEIFISIFFFLTSIPDYLPLEEGEQEVKRQDCVRVCHCTRLQGNDGEFLESGRNTTHVFFYSLALKLSAIIYRNGNCKCKNGKLLVTAHSQNGSSRLREAVGVT